MSTLAPAPASLLPGSHPAGWEKANARGLRHLALALVAVGLLWRCTRYFLAFPLWCDEAMLAVNYLDLDIAGLLGPLINCQIVPFLFHAATLACFKLLGGGELSLQLPAFLACLGSMLLFWRLARLTLPPLGRTLAVAIFAVSVSPVEMGSSIKPYAFDLFASLALLVPAVTWLRRPERLGPLAVLAAVVPITLWASYPAAFVAGGVGLALLPVVWRERKASAWALLAVYGLLLLAAFGSHYLLVARQQLASERLSIYITAGDTGEGMRNYWKEGFPPEEPIAFVRWFVLVHTGMMAGYPIGSCDGASALTTLLGMVGVVALWRGSQRAFVGMVFAVFGLGFVAACLHKYPYGVSSRLAKHVAPFYCLLAGLGAAVLIERWFVPARRRRVTLAVAGLLAAIGIGGTVRDFLHPFRDLETQWIRSVVDDLAARSGDETILVLQPRNRIDPIFAWHLGRRGDRVLWADDFDWAEVGRTRRSLWVMIPSPPREELPDISARLGRSGETWRCVERRPSVMSPENARAALRHCRVYHWLRSED